jgi:RNA polymerase sigma-70 factor (ECF subfamily)
MAVADAATAESTAKNHQGNALLMSRDVRYLCEREKATTCGRSGSVMPSPSARGRPSVVVTSAGLATYPVMSHTTSVSVVSDAAFPPGFTAWAAELVHRHRARLLGYARRRGLTAEDAVDVVQDSFASFLTLREARSIARSGDDALKLLTVIVRHNLLNRRRKVVRQATAPAAMDALPMPDHESSEELLVRAETVARVNGCIAGMSRLQRAVILLSALDERPHEDVGAILGISPGHVRVLLHRARAHLRACPLDEMPALDTQALRASLPSA